MTTIHGRVRRRAIVWQLTRIFERSESSSGRSLPIQKTGRGIWAGTPVRVVAEAAATLGELGVLNGKHQAGYVIDAGTGDGRVPGVLASLNPTLVVHGIESDSALHARAASNLHALATSGLIDSTRVHLLEADYCDIATYETRGIALHQASVIFNYPDGNERHLARFVAEHCGHDTTLCLLTHNRALEVDELDLLARHDINDGTGPPWRLSLYRRRTSAGISVLPAPDGPFIPPRAAEPTRLCSSHHRRGQKAALLHEYPLRVGRRGPHFSRPSAGATLQG